jgi:hypothetical protein
MLEQGQGSPPAAAVAAAECMLLIAPILSLSRHIKRVSAAARQAGDVNQIGFCDAKRLVFGGVLRGLLVLAL